MGPSISVAIESQLMFYCQNSVVTVRQHIGDVLNSVVTVRQHIGDVLNSVVMVR